MTTNPAAAAHTLATLQAWQTAMLGAEKIMNDMAETLGMYPESPVFNAIGALQELATKQAAELVDCELDWLEMWWIEDHFGGKPFEVKIGDGPWQSITGIEQLAAAIVADNQAQTAGAE